jgi:hypothetical protein
MRSTGDVIQHRGELPQRVLAHEIVAPESLPFAVQESRILQNLDVMGDGRLAPAAAAYEFRLADDSLFVCNEFEDTQAGRIGESLKRARPTEDGAFGNRQIGRILTAVFAGIPVARCVLATAWIPPLHYTPPLKCGVS